MLLAGLGLFLLSLFVQAPARADAPTPAAHTVSGTVSSADDGEALPGVNVVVKSAPTTGTITNIDGEFTLTAPSPDDTLVFSFVGFLPQEVAIQGRSVLTVQLSSDVETLDEVVVTALGVERKKRALAYSVAEVKGLDLTQASPVSAASALYGKAPGLQIQQNVTGVTGGSNLQIRGVKSITGDNRPLLIVDGIPIYDNESGLSTVGWDYNQRDLGTGLNNINPNDIESISVLKGASAAALYGAEAANGVVLITTKRGRQGGGLGVEFTSSVLANRVAYLPEFQNEFGAGLSWLTLSAPHDGLFELDENGTRMLDVSSYSWGPRMEGQEILWWDNQMRPYSPQPDNFSDIFEGGYQSKTSIALSNATSRAVYRIGYTRDDYKGTVPGVRNEGNTLSLTGDLEVSTRLSADLALNYYNQQTLNPPPKFYLAYAFPRSVKTDLMEQYYKTEDGFFIDGNDYPRLVGSTRQLMEQVYWKQLQNEYDYDQDRLVGSIGLNYEVNDWVGVNFKAGTDYYDRNFEESRASTRPGDEGASGEYIVRKWQNRVRYGELRVSAERQLGEDLHLDLMVGGAMQRTHESETGSRTSGGLVVPNWFSVSNSQNRANTHAWRAQEAVDGVFASGTASYRDYLFLTATARNDWTSTLPPGENSYFYPSVGLSYVFSDAFTLPAAVTFGQLKANYAEVGRGARRYQANRLYSYGNWEGITTNRFSRVVPPLGLLPERKKEVEVGLNMAFFDDRVGFDAAFYHERNVDQIIDLGVAHSSGATAVTVNNGLMTNTGLELQLYGSPIRTDKFSWDATLNLARNKNEIVELAEGLESLVLENIEDNLYIEARPGKPYGNIYGYDFLRAPDGQRIVDGDGFYAKDSELSLVGNITPDMTGGVINTFRYGNWSLTGVVNFQIGGDMASMTNYYGHATGKWEETLSGRDEATGGLPYYIADDGSWVQLPSHDAQAPNGGNVYHDGAIADGVKEVFNEAGEVVGYEPNDQIVPVGYLTYVQYGWKNQGIYPQVVYDNSYVKLRELVVGYNLPARLIRSLPVQRLNVSLVGRNLLYLYKAIPNIDPESSIGTSARLQGYEYAYYPSTRSFGFRINASF